MNRMSILLSGLLLSAIYGLVGCHAPRIPPRAEVVAMPTDELEAGRITFNSKCASCHPGGRAGVGPSIINKPLPRFLVRWQIRHGLGVMPAFGEEVLSDEEVREIAEYVIHLRKETRQTTDRTR